MGPSLVVGNRGGGPVAAAPSALPAQMRRPAAAPPLPVTEGTGRLQQWGAFLRSLGEEAQSEQAWLKLSSALQKLKELGKPVSANQAKRYVTPSSTLCWKRAGGAVPREGSEWRHLHAAGKSRGQGAGSGRGPLYVKKSFLKCVFLRQYSI